MSDKKSGAFRRGDVIFLCAAAVVLILVQTVLCVYTDVNPYISGTFLAALCIAATAAYCFIRKKTEAALAESGLSEAMSVTASVASSLPYPVVICPADSEKIIWYNKSAAELFGKKNAEFSDIFSTAGERAGTVRLSAGDRIYQPETFTAVGKGGKSYNVFVMTDVTDTDARMDELFGRQCAVAYISVDNLEELLSYEQEDYRNASGEAESILRKWAQSHGGVLKEYQQDKYIFLFQLTCLEEFVKSGFDILDKIRAISVGDAGIPVTVSIGVGVGEGTLADREKEAQTALNTALQRGGDQAVLRDGTEVEIFGGKTKTQQKKTTVRARVVAGELASLMKKASNVLIMGHRFADFDAFGASVGIASMAMHMGVRVNIISDLDDSNLDRCREWIQNDERYVGVFTDRDGALEMIEPDTLLVIVDVNNISQFETSAVAEKCEKAVVIDHHRKTAERGDYGTVIDYIEPSASAASELVAEMLEQILPAGELTAREADLMLAGILLDTNHFTKNTGTRTFSAALYLRGCGADVGEVQEFFKTELEDFQRELKFHENVEIYRDITAIAVPEGDCSFKDKVPAAKAADKLLGVEGVMASFAVVPIGSEVHISARSTGKINVQLLLEGLRGGGHFDSAGTRLEGTDPGAAVKLLKSAIDAYLDENHITAET